MQSKKRPDRPRPQRAIIEQLEPRILLSADLPGLDIVALDTDGPQDVDTDQVLADVRAAFELAAADAQAQSESLQPAPSGANDDAPEAAPVVTVPTEPLQHELVIVDTSVPDYELLLAGVRQMSGEDTELRVVTIDPQQSGIDQITHLLVQYADLDAIHLISHGGDGRLQLGSDTLDQHSLEDKGEFVSSWGDALSSEGDILIYGCNLAATELGEAFVESLADLTGADVAASDDLTGHAEQGGDWDLEYQWGDIETDVSVSQNAQLAWRGILDISTGLVGHWTFDSDGSDSSGNARDGLLTGNAAIDTTPGTNRVGAGKVVLDGANDYLDLSSHASALGTLSQGTIAGWINTSDSANTQAIFGVADLGDPFSFGTFGVWNGKLFFDVAENGSVNDFSLSVSSDAGVADGNWHHVALTVGATGNSFYIDGAKIDAANLNYVRGNPGTTAFLDTVNDVDAVQIGVTGESGAYVYDFNGLVDDVRVYDRALSNNDIAELYATSATNSGLVAHYQFEDASGTTATDSTAYANHATLAGGATFEAGVISAGLNFAADSGQNTLATIADDPSMDFGSGDFTISFWTYTPSGGGSATILRDGDTGSSGMQFEALANGNILWSFSDGGVNDNFTIATTTDQWQLVTVTRASNVFQTYIDDGAYGGKVSGVADLSSSSPWVLGAYSAGSADFDGKLDDVRFYDRAISGAEVAALHGLRSNMIVDTAADYSNADARYGDTSSVDALLDDKGSDGMISLREAIDAANNQFGASTVSFNIGTSDAGYVDPDATPGNGDEYWVIAPTSYLGDITDSIVLDATTQSGYSNKPVIEMDGGSAGGATAALTLRTSDSVVRGFAIHGFGDDGIEIDGTVTGGVADNNLVELNWIGFDAEGNDSGVGDDGVLITDGASFNTIRDNVIGNSAGAGILIRENLVAGTSDNTIVGNLIGTDVTGLLDKGNTQFGIEIDGSSGNQIGGSTAAERNVISGNGKGISLWNAGSTLNVIQGNYIGTDVTGNAPLGNSDDGIVIGGDANNNTIGGDRTAGEGNVISGQVGALSDGVEIDNAGADDNKIYGNFIGTNQDGTAKIANARYGVVIYNGVQGTQVGGTGTGQGNIISGNADAGIMIDGNNVAATSGNLIQANFIGTDATGMVDLGNTTDGVVIMSGAQGNTIGGTTTAHRNLISGNDNDGIWITGSNTDGNTVQGNWIGLDAASGALGNSFHGIGVQNGASDNLIGGADSGEANTIANNAWDGISTNSTSTGNSFIGNSIYNNVDLGIDIEDGIEDANGVTSNDSNDGDAGANDLQNFPVITQADLNGTDLTVSGTLDTDGALNHQYLVEFFGNAAGTQDPTNGEGRYYLGSILVTTDGSGDASFANQVLSGVTQSVGDYVTATATRVTIPGMVGIDDLAAYGSTSEFAANVAIADSNQAPTTSGIADFSVSEDPGFSFIDLKTVFEDAEDADTALTYTITANTDPSLFDVASIGGTGVLTLDYAANTNGAADITIRATDTGGKWVETTFTVTVNPVNDAPTLTAGTVANLNVDEDAGMTSLGLGSVAYGPGGGADESAQTLTYTVTTIPDTLNFGKIYLADGTTQVSTGVYSLVQLRGMQFEPATNETGGPSFFEYSVSDSGGTANGGVDSISESIQITINSVNDAPTLSTSNSTPTFTENAGAVGLFSGTSIDPVEVGDLIESLVVTVDGLVDGSDEILVIDGQTIELTNLNNETTASNGYDVSVSLSGSTATLTVTKTGGFSAAAAETLVDGMAYNNTSENPQGVSRVVTLTSIKDDGGTANGGSDTKNIGIASLVTMDALNDDPSNNGSLPTDVTVLEDMSTGIDLSAVDFADPDHDNQLLTVTLTTSTGGNLYASSDIGVIVGGSGSGVMTLTGGIADLNTFFDSATRIQYLHGTANAAGNNADTIQVQIRDNGNTGSGGGGNINLGMLNVDITNVNDAPAGTNNTVSTNEDTDYVFATADFGFADVNDSPADSFAGVIIAVAPSNGTLYVDADGDGSVDGGEALAATDTVAVADIAAGKLKLKPVADANGMGYDSFTFQVKDGGGTANSGVDTDPSANTITIDVVPVDDAAVITGDTSFSGDEGDAVSGDLDATDIEGLADGDYFSISAQGTNGTAAIDAATGVWTFTPASADWFGSDSFTVTVTDDLGGTTTQLVSITLANVDDAAVITGDTSFNGDEGDAVSGDLNATDIEGLTDGDYFSISTQGANGTAAIDAATGAWTFAPTSADWFGSDSFTVTATDDLGGTTTQVVSITLANVNDTPLIGGVDTGAVTEDVDPDLDTLLASAGALTISDADPGESSFAATSISGAHGNLTIDAAGNWTYAADNTAGVIQQMDAGESASDVFTVASADGTTHAITITIHGAEDAPLISGDTGGSVTKGEVLSATGTLSITDVDASDNPVSFPDQALALGDNGYGDFELIAGTWTYALNTGNAAVEALQAGGSLTDTFSFSASDGSVQLVTVSIQGADDVTEPPVVVVPEPEPEPEPIELPPGEDPTEPPGPDESDPEQETEPELSPPEGDEPGALDVSLPPLQPVPLEPNEVILSVLSNRSGGAVGSAMEKPSIEHTRTFLQELKSFWQVDREPGPEDDFQYGQSEPFWTDVQNMLNDMDRDADKASAKMQLTAEAAAGVSLSLTAGFVSWALRAGSMVASFLAAMPTWRNFDPMPVLSSDEDKQKNVVTNEEDNQESTVAAKEDSKQDAEVDAMFDR